MKRTIVLLVSVCVVFFSACTDSVKLSGSLKDFKAKQVDMKKCGIAADVYDCKTVIEVDSNGLFQLELKLKRPAYYLIGHNLLYLSPGDDLKVKLGYFTVRGEYQGAGEEADVYLKGREELSGWKIFDPMKWALGKNSRIPTFEKCRATIDSVIGARLQDLNRLMTVDKRFRELETVRVKASQLQIYLDYFSYGQLSKWDDKAEVKQEKKNAFYRTIKPLVEPLLKELTASDDYLELAEVREVLNECHASGVFEFPQSATFAEWVKVQEQAALLDGGVKKADYESHKDFARGIRNKDLKQAFSAKLQRRAMLMEGQPAPDILLKDIDGNELKLSDLKGKPLFVDIWATWCFPCLAQMPHFQELSAQYPEIQFVGISIDLEEQRWKNKLEKEGIPPFVKEYISSPYDLEEAWDLASIPRFILIDKDFKIITAFAVRPSEKEKIGAILDAIKG